MQWACFSVFLHWYELSFELFISFFLFVSLYIDSYGQMIQIKSAITIYLILYHNIGKCHSIQASEIK